MPAPPPTPAWWLHSITALLEEALPGSAGGHSFENWLSPKTGGRAGASGLEHSPRYPFGRQVKLDKTRSLLPPLEAGANYPGWSQTLIAQ
jgi:hypothetical protein